jgi:site-specific recombinase XerD
VPSASKRYSYRTEQAYVGRIKRYIYFHDVHHTSEMGAPEVEAFLTHLAVKENVAAATQNQALSALQFLYQEALHQDSGPVDALRAKRLPTVLTKDETLRLTGCLSGTQQLMAKPIYGSGIRLWNACACVSKTSSLGGVLLSSAMAKGRKTG